MLSTTLIKLFIVIFTTFILLLVIEVVSIIKYDLTDFKANDRGPAKIKIYLKSITYSYRLIGRDTSCEIKATSKLNEKCDYIVTIYVCIMPKFTYNQNLTENIQIFRVDEYESVIFATPPDYMICPRWGKTELPDNNDYFFFPLNETLMIKLSEFDSLFPYIIYLEVDYGDRLSKEEIHDYINYDCINHMSMILRPQANGFSIAIHRSLTTLGTYDFFEIATKTECLAEHYGRFCWMQCLNNTRQTCYCPSYHLEAPNPCNINCKPGWLGLVVEKFWRNIIVELKTCLVRDLCQNNTKCNSVETCLVLDNTSYTCEQLILSIMSNVAMVDLINSTAFIYGETIKVQVNTDLIKTKSIIPYIFIRPTVDSLVYELNILHSIRYSPMFVATVYGLDYIDKLFHSQFNMFIDPWNINLVFPWNMRVLYPPSNISIIHTYNSMKVKDVVYLSETLRCTSQVQPSYRSLTIWYAEGINFDEPFLEDQTILMNQTSSQMCVIQCTVYLIIDGRNFSTNYIRLNVIIHPYLYFKWSTKRDIIGRDTDLKCLKDSFDGGYLRIYYIAGATEIYMLTDTIPLMKLQGDVYQFLCVFRSSSTFVTSKLKEFILLNYPTKICFPLVTLTWGSVIQCSHDGFLPERYNLFIDLRMSSLANSPLVTGDEYLRIPYFIDYNIIHVTCSITTAKYNKHIMNKSMIFKLHKTSYSIYEINDDTLDCARFTEFVELPDIRQNLSDKQVVLEHYIYYLEIHYEMLGVELMPILVIVLLLLVIILYSQLMKLLRSRQFYGAFNVSKYLTKMLIRRQISDELATISYDMIMMAKHERANVKPKLRSIVSN